MDVTQDLGIQFDKENASVKFDLNGNTFTVNTGSNVSNRAIRIDNGTLEVYGGTIVAAGSGTNKDNGSGCYGAFRVEKDGVLNAHDLSLSNARPWGLNVKVLGGEATLTNVNITSSYGGGIEVSEEDLDAQHTKPGVATLTNCHFTQTGYYDHCSSPLSVSGGSTLIINSGTYTTDSGYGLYVFSSGGVIDVKGGTFSSTSDKPVIIAAIDTGTYPQYTGGLTISGGTFTGTYSITSPAYMSITGGTFDHDPSAYVAPGYVATQSGNVWTVAPVSGVAAIGTQGYETLTAAFAAVQNGQTITLLDNVSLTDRLFVNAGATPAYAGTDNRYATTSENKSITLDLNGHNITSTSNFAQAGGTFNITNTGTADDTHGVISTTNAGLAPVEVRGTGDLTAQRTLNVGTGVTLTGTTYGLNVFGSNTADLNKIEVNVNGTVNGTIFVLGNLKNTDNAISINVNGKVYVAANNDNERNVGVALNGYASVNVASTANVKGETGIEVRAGVLTVNGGTITGTAGDYSCISNGNGSSTKGAAIAVVQHTTALTISATINGGTLTGVKQLAVANPENTAFNNVSVLIPTTLANSTERVVVPEGYLWKETGTGTSTLVKAVAQIGTTKYFSLKDAVAAVPDNTETTITMIGDDTIMGNAGITITSSKQIILDLNGHTVKNAVNENKASQVFNNLGVFKIIDTKGGGVLKNGIEEGTQPGEWWSTPQYNYTTNVVTNSGTLTIDGAKLHQTASGSICYAVDNNSTSYDATLNLVSGILTSERTVVRQFCNSAVKNNTVNISGGEITTEGKAGLWIQLPGSNPNSMKMATLNISGGTLRASENAFYDYSYGDGWDNVHYSVTGGTFIGEIYSYAVVKHHVMPGFVTGGTFNVDPSDYVSAGYEAVQSGNNWNVQVKATPEMWINHAASSYESVDETNKIIEIRTAAQLAKLAKDIQDNDANPSTFEYMGWTFKLTSDIDLSGKIWTPIGADLTNYYYASFRGTFDGNGHKITNMHAVANEWSGLFGPIHSGMEVTIKDLTIDTFTVESNHYAGGIVGWVEQATEAITFSNCVVSNGAITSSPHLKGNEYDDGDKVGGICGFAYKSTSSTKAFVINNNTVSNVNITAYRDLGGLLGYAQNMTVSGNTVSNVNIYQNNTNAYKESAISTYGVLVGRNSASTISEDDNTVSNVSIYSGTPGSYSLLNE